MCSRRPRTLNSITLRRPKQEKIDPPCQDAFSAGCGSPRRNANDVPCPHGRSTSNAARERSRVRLLRTAFLNLQLSLPAVPPDTKLSKLDVLLLATDYIAHLRSSLARGQGGDERGARGGEDGEEGFHATSVCTRSRGITHGTRLRVHRSSRGTPYGLGVTGVRNRQREERAPTETHCRFTEDRLNKHRFERHPTKKWPMRARLYDGIVNSAREPKLREAYAVDDTLGETHK